MEQQNFSVEIDLRQLAKKLIRISANRKKTFSILLIVFLVLSTIYFFKVLIRPSYKSEVVLKSRYVKKDQLASMVEKLNIGIEEEDDKSIPDSLYTIFKKNHIVKFEMKEIKPDITDPDKNDLFRQYILTAQYSQKPDINSLDIVNEVINYIKVIAAQDNEIKAGKLRVEKTIQEIDSLVAVAFMAGNDFKNKINTGTGSLLVLNDLYKSINDIVKTKRNLTIKKYNL